MRQPYTIGISGGSGSGKTFFIEQLSAHFQPHEICLISQDHYYRPIEHQVIDDQGVQNFDLPGAIERDQLHADILKLKRGETLYKKEYTFNKPNAVPKTFEFRPAPILIVEGLFVQYYAEIEKELDLKIFIEAKDYLKLSRRIRRDNDERGYDLDDVLYRYQHHVMPVYESLIKPLMHHADFIIPNNRHFERALHVIVNALKTHL
ncbi:uridine kinase family protein [Chryseolinea lacunae]|uniref:Uridine kinase n=1 Tax=Chryseolinea lacunae TaxID=2801331 RepID=A0ABS1KVD5_9BACT|nr:uridine kinase [Chryseolinea lacunae]MBL0743425.1 uridine kinase [Chryseolinea lacunae]